MSKRDFLIFFLDFTVGLAILTIVFHYLLSLPIEKSLIIAVILSLIFGIAFILEKVLKRSVKREYSALKLTRGDKVILVMMSLVSLIFGTLGIHHILVIPLLNSFLIAVILTILLDFAYIVYVKRRKPKEKQVYSIRQFLLESFFALLIFLPAYLSGIDLGRSLAIGLYIFILIHWYYNFLPHRYVFPKRFVVARTVLVFFITFYGWYTLVKTNLALSLLVAALTSSMMELDRRASVKLAEMRSEEELESIGRRAGALFQPLGIIYGMVVGVMAVSKIYGTWYFAWWLLELYRLAYIFTTMFLIPSSLISWIAAYVKQKRSDDVKVDYGRS